MDKITHTLLRGWIACVPLPRVGGLLVPADVVASACQLGEAMWENGELTHGQD
jgi:hypothetical protein